MEDELNRIYSPAVVNWEVSIGETISSEELPDLNYEDFQTGNVDMLKRYTVEMKRVYKYYKRTYGTNKNTQYLFFIKYPDADKKGFMFVSSFVLRAVVKQNIRTNNPDKNRGH